MKLSRRTVAKVETWVNKQKPAKLRKMLEDDWVTGYEPRDIENMTDEEVREVMMADIQANDDHVEAVLESIGIEAEYSDDEDTDLNDEDDDDFGDNEEE